jgi:hypothetical protein
MTGLREYLKDSFMSAYYRHLLGAGTEEQLANRRTFLWTFFGFMGIFAVVLLGFLCMLS